MVHIVDSEIETSVYSLLSTVVVHYTYNEVGERHEARALDLCSQTNSITTALYYKHGLTRRGLMTVMTISGIEHVGSIRENVTIKLQSHCYDYNKKLTHRASNEIDKSTSSSLLQLNEYNVTQGLGLAETDFDKPGPIDTLIGINSFFEMLCMGQLKPTPGGPTLQKNTC